MPGPATETNFCNNTMETDYLSFVRNKRNAACILGSLILAGRVSAIGESWNVFTLVAAVLTGTPLLSGEIRVDRQIRSC
jgi:hypothetical protein